MKSPLQDYFDFSRKEQMGLLSLVGIILICLAVINFYPFLFPEVVKDISVKESELMIAIQTEREKKEATYTQQFETDDREKKPLPEPFVFDPNTLSTEGYVSLGFSQKQAQSILKYISKGGRIRTVEEFKKLYVVDEFTYQRLKDFIEIAPIQYADRSKVWPKDNYPVKDSKPAVRNTGPVDLNNADTTQLIALSGIGPFYAKRIIKYREILGGYSSVDQLSEVYGLKDHPEVIESLRPQLTIGEYTADLIDLNSCEWKDLVRHPYIDEKVAGSIIAIRETHGSYNHVEDIKQSHLISDDLYIKISPYLTIGSR